MQFSKADLQMMVIPIKALYQKGKI